MAAENLYASIREQVVDCFKKHDIAWWLHLKEREDRADKSGLQHLPTGHLNSSQVACVNHLEPARSDAKLALRIAQRIEPTVRDVLPIEDGGFVAYEWIGNQSYLSERGGRTRGANITSLDALMLVRRAHGDPCLVVFEWKYLECYPAKCVAVSDKGTDRVKTYQSLLLDPAGPIAVEDPKSLFWEPYCQLMRQTLLAWRMCEARELGASEWIHVNVVPAANAALRTRVAGAAPQLAGKTMADAWRSALREPARYRLMTPTEVVPDAVDAHWRPWRDWLNERYLT
jgi:hypothetical protein